MIVTPEKIRHCRVTVDWIDVLSGFFADLTNDDDARWFHPHPFTREAAEFIACYSGRDLYVAQEVNGRMSGYGMLRGWDAGFDVPGLGLVVHPAWRGRRLGLELMRYLHDCAAAAGADRIRIKVYEKNHGAVCLYKKLGYQFSDRQGDQWIGWLQLTGIGSVPRAQTKEKVVGLEGND